MDVISNHYYEEEDYIRGLQNGSANTVIDELNYLSPSVRSLRYLVFRNRGYLYYEILKSNAEILAVSKLEDKTEIEGSDIEDRKKQHIRELFYSMIDDMIISLIYQEADEKLLNTLYEIFTYLNSAKLARFTLEYLISGKDESDDLFGLIPVEDLCKQKYKLLLQRLHISKPSSSDGDGTRELELIKEKLAFLEPIKADYNTLIENTTNLKTVNINIEYAQRDLNWTSVIDDINKKVKHLQDKEKSQELSRLRIKDLDPYLLTENPIERVRFTIPVPEDESTHDDDVEKNDSKEVDKENNEVPDGEILIDEGSNHINSDEEIFLEAREFLEKEINDGKETQDSKNPSEKDVEGSTCKLDHIPANREVIEGEKHISEENAISKSAPMIQRSSKRVRYRNEESSMEINDVEITRSCFVETERFFENLNLYLDLFNKEAATNLTLTNIVNIYVPEKNNNDENSAEGYVNDFLFILNDWNTRKYTHSLFVDDDAPGGSTASKSTEDEKIKLMEVLSTFGKKGDSLNLDLSKDIKDISSYETTEEIQKFLHDINENPCHYEELKLLILRKLLSIQRPKGDFKGHAAYCLITDTIWNSKLYDRIREWTIQCESIILNHLRLEGCDALGISHMLDDFSFSVAIYEILVDTYISIKDQINSMTSLNYKRTTHKPNKATLNNISLELVKIGDKLNRWTQHFEDLLERIDLSFAMMDQDFFTYYCRYKWSFIHKEKSQNTIWQEKGFIMSQLHELHDNILTKKEAEAHIPLPNYENINEISVDSIKTQVTTTSILSILAKILYAKPGTNNDEAIHLLETILISDSSPDESIEALPLNKEVSTFDKDALIAIKDFLEESPVDMKLSSWNILFLYYDENNQFAKFQHGFEQNVSFILYYLNSNTYNGLIGTKFETLAKVLGSYGKHVRIFLSHLRENNWKLSRDLHRTSLSIERTFSELLKLFELFYLFSIHEEAALISSSKLSVKARSNKAYERFKDIFISTVSVIVIYYKELLMNTVKIEESKVPSEIEKTIGNLICDFHEQLGWRRVCDAAEGLFLNLAQDILVAFDNNLFEKQLAQLISCRYHYSVSIDTFTPANHETKKTAEFDLSSTQRMADFILPLCFKKNPLKATPKSDMKLLIDEFYEVVGDPDFDSCEILSRNDSLFEHFLESTSITSRFLRDTFYGLEELDFRNPPDNANIIRSGLYYMQGLLMFASYKIRKKSTQSRAVELENIIMLLKNDLVYCTNRMESWFLLGQAYGFLVEDDLIWTSDKLTVPERKIGTANLQRKSLICYLMAINESTKANIKKDLPLKTTIGSLMALFSKEMYNAAMKPMDMHAFKVQNIPRFIKKPTGAAFVSVSTSSVNSNLCLKVIQQSLHIAIKSKRNDWTYYYYLSKVQRKLNKSPRIVLDTLQQASNIAKEQSNPSDPIIEPHYKKCSLIYKYAKEGSLSFQSGLEFLKNDLVINYEKGNKSIEKPMDFYEIIVECLKAVISYDKKRWHHKPRYRLAKVLFEEFGKITEAKEEISSIVSLKSTNKTLVLIWKPENERPGKHFYYTFQYAHFYVVLLSSDRNLIGLIQMLPKLRRSNSIMVSLYSLWETLCSSICKIIRNLLKVDEGFTERFMLSLGYQKFMMNSKSLLENMKGDGVPGELQIHLCFLHAITDMKKLNNGFGPTSLIDDTMVAIFIRIYLYFEKQLNNLKPMGTPEPTESPNEKAKKLAKRDFFPLISDMLKTFRRDIENILKDQPDIYNDFVSCSDKKVEKEGVVGKENNVNSKILEEEQSREVIKTPELKMDSINFESVSDKHITQNKLEADTILQENNDKSPKNNGIKDNENSIPDSRARTLDEMLFNKGLEKKVQGESPTAKKQKLNSDHHDSASE